MSLHVLDTDILALYQLGNVAVCERVAKHTSHELAVTIITVEEQLSGWYTLRRRVKGWREACPRLRPFCRERSLSLAVADTLIFRTGDRSV